MRCDCRAASSAPTTVRAGASPRHYRGVGAAVYFLMNFDGGRYRGDFIDMLRDSYRGVRHSPEFYFGLSEESLDFLMQRFYGGTYLPIVESNAKRRPVKSSKKR